MTDFAATKSLFHIPEGVIYLDGNSLGMLPKTAATRAKEMIEQEWGKCLSVAGTMPNGWSNPNVSANLSRV